MLEYDTENYVIKILDLVADYLFESGFREESYENDVFLMHSRNEDEIPNFWLKESNYQVVWYDHIGRATTSNMPMELGDSLNLLWNCLSSIDFDDTPRVYSEPWHVSGVEDDE